MQCAENFVTINFAYNVHAVIDTSDWISSRGLIIRMLLPNYRLTHFRLYRALRVYARVDAWRTVSSVGGRDRKPMSVRISSDLRDFHVPGTCKSRKISKIRRHVKTEVPARNSIPMTGWNAKTIQNAKYVCDSAGTGARPFLKVCADAPAKRPVYGSFEYVPNKAPPPADGYYYG